MMDVVERLRLGGPNAMEAAPEAADEIERLRATLSHIAEVAKLSTIGPRRRVGDGQT